MIEGSKTGKSNPIVTYGMVGGGEGAFIGDVHRHAIAFDGKARLVAGSFSRSMAKTLSTGEELHVDKDRLYETYAEMAAAEAARDDGIDFVAVVTPNASHYAISKAFLEKGINVVCDKPLTTDSGQAEELAALAKKNNLLFAVTYTYSGYPTVKHARAMIAAGEIGDIRFVNAEYPQEWLAEKLEDSGQKQASWRSDPAQSGISNCVGDIGSHIENTVSYMTGLKIKRLSARLDTFVEDRILDDNATIMLDYQGGAKGVYWSSQVAVGHDNGLAVRIYGSKGSIRWRQEDPNYLEVSYLDKPSMKISRGRDTMKDRAESLVRVPAGHPEGYFEAFANIYKTFIDALVKKASGAELNEDDLDFPTPEAGAEGVRFIEKCVESSKKDAAWLEL
jgi:predicted dehydrogenase